MKVMRINEFSARKGDEGRLKLFLTSIVPVIESSDGCLDCKLLKSNENPTRFVVLETWDSLEAHQRSLKTIKPGSLDEVMKMLACAPRGEYFELF